MLTYLLAQRSRSHAFLPHWSMVKDHMLTYFLYQRCAPLPFGYLFLYHGRRTTQIPLGYLTLIPPIEGEYKSFISKVFKVCSFSFLYILHLLHLLQLFQHYVFIVALVMEDLIIILVGQAFQSFWVNLLLPLKIPKSINNLHHTPTHEGSKHDDGILFLIKTWMHLMSKVMGNQLINMVGDGQWYYSLHPLLTSPK